MMDVVVVESPAKAKTINKYLGRDYTVLASYGHVRDLPSKDGSVRPDEDFAMLWDMDAKSAKRVAEIARAVRNADRLILATDPDREGEAISWHVLEVLKKKGALKGVEVSRVVFNAITKSSVLDAMASPRAIDSDLVDAYLARRALDYLVGFTLSPVLWRKLPGARSAGRVQSVALRLICDREMEIESFVSREYWTIDALLKTGQGAEVRSRLHARNGTRLGKFDLGDEAAAMAVAKAVGGGDFRVASVEARDARRHPQPPFTTSTLQQEASRKLGFSASRTMQVAQRLYEGIALGGDTVGLITYMRTDGVTIAPEAIAATRGTIERQFGQTYVPPSPRLYKAKAKNAQEAHEAIRPTDLARLPRQVQKALDADQAKLYDLIWKRTIASQMESARLERTTADIETKGADGVLYTFRATGTVVRFDGFLKLYQEGADDAGDKGDKPEDRRLPPLEAGALMVRDKITPDQHFTEPPPRFSEASLIRRMEELGIGRPSTYAQTLKVLGDREYVVLEKRRFIPEDKGRLVTSFLGQYFNRFVEFDFTAELETKLDRVSNGEIEWKSVLRDFWGLLSKDVEDVADLRVSEVLESLNEVLGPHIFPDAGDGVDPRKCTSCDDGRLSLKVGRYGAFIGCSNYPECRFTRQLSKTDGGDTAGAADGRVLGADPETGLEITVNKGRFGPYLQLGQAEKGEKPKRASIPKPYEPETITLEPALRLLSLPREVGPHPETGEMITAGLGRYGPFVKHEKTYANVDSIEEVFNVGLNRAVALIAEKKARGPGRNAAKALKDLGPHPVDGEPVRVMDGRYGPYVKHGKTNATLPKGKSADEITMDEAVALIEAKAGPKGKGRAKAKAKPKTKPKTKAKPKAKPKTRAKKPATT
ncbi:DNA topoisomerase I [hydrothermal vent metagenome]|uniref:DNA topoisomerase n=1 Tax=hydrothermal vent metagenome TaxID=652676 RepID=A0A3B0TWW3_9ZZZZ